MFKAFKYLLMFLILSIGSLLTLAFGFAFVFIGPGPGLITFCLGIFTSYLTVAAFDAVEKTIWE